MYYRENTISRQEDNLLSHFPYNGNKRGFLANMTAVYKNAIRLGYSETSAHELKS